MPAARIDSNTRLARSKFARSAVPSGFDAASPSPSGTPTEEPRAPAFDAPSVFSPTRDCESPETHDLSRVLYVTAVGSTPFARISSTNASARATSPTRTNPSTIVEYVCALGDTPPSSDILRIQSNASSTLPTRAKPCTSAVYACTVGRADGLSPMPLRNARSAEDKSPHRAYAATLAPCVAALGRTLASLMARSASLIPNTSPARPAAAMRTLYSLAPGFSPRRFISRTSACARSGEPLAMYAPTAAVNACASGTRSSDARSVCHRSTASGVRSPSGPCFVFFFVIVVGSVVVEASSSAAPRLRRASSRLESAVMRSVKVRRVGSPPARTYASKASATSAALPALTPCLTSDSTAIGDATTFASSASRNRAFAW
mmetsp:Transcript_91/g.428  ORF Transcript_91/g.428 Transcript_91/m.428 type:complete len:375 (-) Transcript_91:565-1689(-)